MGGEEGRASQASPAKREPLPSKSQQSVSAEEDEDVMFFKAGKDKDPQSSSAQWPSSFSPRGSKQVDGTLAKGETEPLLCCRRPQGGLPA